MKSQVSESGGDFFQQTAIRHPMCECVCQTRKQREIKKKGMLNAIAEQYLPKALIFECQRTLPFSLVVDSRL